ncbi:MAG: hypothetical protein COV44_11615 [Deltaproteobacteria bacterium CG11_big_fil_rev_8_21_14_0_20_45_16]|nr:MAG: hypothetical protein COV44_11615 [Deltaproteobacteria bacterium CG11_big_fil_rev_8_21_14_0_20_45_16]
MTFNQIRLVDKYVGLPLCFIFSLWRKLVGRWFPREKNATPKKLLFIKLIEQGSNIITYDAIQTAKERLGDQNVYFWIFEENKPALDLLNVLPQSQIFSVRNSNLFYFAMDILNSLRKIWSLKIDCVVDLEFFARAPALLTYLTGAAIRVGCHRYTSEGPYRGDLMTHRVQYNFYMHTSKFFRLLLEAAFQNPSDTPLVKENLEKINIRLGKFDCHADEEMRLRRILETERKDIFKGPIVLLNANASDMIPIRKWESKKYLELGRRIMEAYPNSTIVLTGAPSERTLIDGLCHEFNSNRVISMAGKTSFRELIILYTLADLLVTNDSGPSHFSSLTDIHTITLFGPETPQLYAPLGQGKKFIWSQLACSPCVNVFNHRFTPCTNNRCMQSIKVDQVFAMVQESMAERGIQAVSENSDSQRSLQFS